MKRKILASLVACLILFFGSWNWSEAQTEEQTQEMEAAWFGDSVKVMTRNVYIGADVDPILEAPFEEIPFMVAQLYKDMLLTDFRVRAKALAKEIAQYKPHLVGLQEITYIYVEIGSSGEEWNYLEILLSELNSLCPGMYDVPYFGEPAINKNIEIMLPLYDLETGAEGFVYVEDYDVILARNDVSVTDVATKDYSTVLIVPTPEPYDDIIVGRGYVSVDAQVGSKAYRFVNTHLEPYKIDGIFPYFQIEQAKELIADLENETLPIITVGDYNTLAPIGIVYLMMRAAGYEDAWCHNRLKWNIFGFTSPHDADLRNKWPKLYQRIDLIFVRNQAGIGGSRIGPVYAIVVGDQRRDRIYFPPTGEKIWPSDHAGVVAQLRMPVF